MNVIMEKRIISDIEKRFADGGNLLDVLLINATCDDNDEDEKKEKEFRLEKIRKRNKKEAEYYEEFFKDKQPQIEDELKTLE